MKKLSFTLAILISIVFSISAQENIRKVATWNMKWLGTNSYNQLDAIENVNLYADYILETEATLFALQEIGATHSVAGNPKCFYLNLIVDTLNKSIPSESDQWTYILDGRNKQQRLAFLYKKDKWELTNPRSINPGSSYNYIRKPFFVTVQAKGSNAELKFDYINLHLKAFNDPDARGKRQSNFEELSNWLETNTLDSDVLISGDTNIYFGETEVYQSIKDISYKYLYDAEKTAIHEDILGQRFDRFYSSPGLLNEILSAKEIVGKKNYIDVIKDNDPEKVVEFDQNISDHYAVVLSIDVSEEQ
jgi:endonuclease/exonuclease/phosphatase family metal-dependent hydrolase